tara:strand:- start:3353 stop:4336 length:984 start_codon:yes stop_codon:yes gene_type:complete
VWKKKDEQLVSSNQHIVLQKYSLFNLILQPFFLWRFSKELIRADKVILHGLNELLTMLIILLGAPLFREKGVWFYWGAELHKFKKSTLNFRDKILLLIQTKAVRNIGYIAVGMPGEYNDIRTFFNIDSTPIWSFKYPSNVIDFTEKPEPEPVEFIQQTSMKIMIGHSADPSNEHMRILNQLYQRLSTKDDYSLYMPLSYGFNENLEQIKTIGYKLFGDNFIPVPKLLSLSSYRSYLSEINMAIFPQERQQGMGNITYLLANGATVYLRPEANHSVYFKKLGIIIGSSEDITLKPILETQSKSNRRIMGEVFSKKTLVKQLLDLFNKE